MIDLRQFGPESLNKRVSNFLRSPAAFVLASGAALCFSLLIATLREPGDQPHPALFIAFHAAVGSLSGTVAVKLFRGDQLLQPVRTPPRASVVRVLGFVVFLISGLAALVSDTWWGRLETGSLALFGLGWLIWPRHFLPPSRDHGA